MDNQLTIITPSCRPNNLKKLFDSINFEKIYQWIICYDTSKNRTYTKQFNSKKILEIEADGTNIKAYNGKIINSIAGHHQFNTALNLVKSGYVYRLDDDNIMHLNFWNYTFVLNENPQTLIYTFDSVKKNNEIYTKGNDLTPGKIDSACFCINKKLIKEDQWHAHGYGADGEFIKRMHLKNNLSHYYIPEVMAYYNYLR